MDGMTASRAAWVRKKTEAHMRECMDMCPLPPPPHLMNRGDLQSRRPPDEIRSGQPRTRGPLLGKRKPLLKIEVLLRPRMPILLLIGISGVSVY